MKILKGKSKRAKIFGLITIAVIAVLFGLNLLLSVLGLNRSVYVDLTPEGLYSVTDRMAEECSFIDDLDEKDPEKKVEIIFCNDPDRLMDSTITRVTYFMALKLDKMFDNLEVKEINVNFNPTAVSKYKATSLTEINTSHIIVAYGDRYRIVGAESFWTTGSEGGYWSYNGEYKMATIIKSVTLANDSNPVAYFVSGHGTLCYDETKKDSIGTLATEEFKNLLLERGLRVKTIDLSKEDIPSDCALLIINNPTEDFSYDQSQLGSFTYVSELEKIDRYLTKNQGALMVAKDPGITLPIFEDFLAEWGFELSSTTLQIPIDESKPVTPDNRTDVISAVYDTDTESYAYAIYGEFAALSSAPKTVLGGAGYIDCSFGETTSMTESGALDVARVYSSFLSTPQNAIPYVYGSETSPAGNANVYDMAAVTTRTEFDNVRNEYTYSYVFCANDADFFSNASLGNASYANFEIMSALIANMSRVDIYASSDLGGTSLNTKNFGGKQLVDTNLYSEDTEIYEGDASFAGINRGITLANKVLITVIIAIVPVALLTLGIIIFAKRKHM